VETRSPALRWRPVSCCCTAVQQRHDICYVQCTVPAIKAVLCIEINQCCYSCRRLFPHAQLSVVGNCSSVCSGGEETAGGRGWSAVAGGGGRTDSTRGERIWSVSNGRKLSVGFCYYFIHILWVYLTADQPVSDKCLQCHLTLDKMVKPTVSP
jgi:hypothetical protein